jgi:hypothetical protein
MLWPIRYKLLPDELLSSWLVRLAHGFGLKVQTFSNLLFGCNYQVWNRDIDRFAPDWLVEQLSSHTGTPKVRSYNSTLRSYEGILFDCYKASGALPWIQSLKIYHRKRNGFGVQFCGACLKEDTRPYFRKRWRLAFNTICSKHDAMLQDRCPACGAAVAFHRIDMRHRDGSDATSLAICHACSFNLSESPLGPIVHYDTESLKWQKMLAANLEVHCDRPDLAIPVDEMRVLHHLVALFLSRYESVKLRQFVCAELGIEDFVSVSGRLTIESRPLRERHLLVQLGAWLLLDLKTRLTTAWHCRAVRYNSLLKDFDQAPNFYAQVVDQLPRRGGK